MFIFPFVAAAEALAMGLEALSVINLRMQLFSKGGEDASREANLMVSEKMTAFGQMLTDVAFGSTYSAVCDNFRTAIAANECRLTQLQLAAAPPDQTKPV